MAQNGVPDKDLTPAQKRAIAALLAERDVRAAAQAARVAERTLWRWMAKPEFRQALTRAGDDLIDGATRRLQAGQQKALDVLEEIMDSEKPDQRRLAAQGWLELVLKWHELRTLTKRVADLEGISNGNTSEAN